MTDARRTLESGNDREWLNPLPSDGSKGVWVLAPGKEIGFCHIPSGVLFAKKEFGGLGATVKDGAVVFEYPWRK